MAADPALDQWRDLRERLATFMDRPESSWGAAAFQAAVVVLIFLSTSAAIAETVPEVGHSRMPAFIWLEATVTVTFTLELAMRFVSCESLALFFFNGFNIVDLLAVLPGFILILNHFDSVGGAQAGAMMSLRMARFMWLVRILRLAKVARHSRLLAATLAVLSKVWHTSILVMLGLFLSLTILSSSLLYLVESDRCQELGLNCGGFESIPGACWFAISTLTTVGYGDLIPETGIGKVIASLFSICAVLVVALAGALISRDFSEHFREERERRRVDLELSLSSNKGRELRDLQEMACDARAALDALVGHLAVAAAKRLEGAEGGGSADEALEAYGPPPLALMPMLRLLQERARLLSTELQSCVHATSLATAATAKPARPAHGFCTGRAVAEDVEYIPAGLPGSI